MNNEFNNIIKAVKTVKLSENEKAIMKSNIISGVVASPYVNVTNHIPDRLYYLRGIENYFNLLTNQNNFMSALIIAIMLALTGGTSVIAENSVPGDALYTVKTSFNEPIAGLFAVGKESNAVWQERIVERRLEEIQKIVSEGNLSTTTKAEIETNINNQINKFADMSKDLSEDKDSAISSAELAVRLESALKAHQSVLQRVSDEVKTSTSTKETTKELISVLKERENDVKDDRKRMELALGDGLAISNSTVTSTTSTSTQVTPAAVINKQNVAQKILDNVKAKYQEEKNTLSSSTISKVDAELLNVEKVLVEGKAYVASGKYDLAFNKFQDVIKLANQARVTMLTNSIKINIEDDMDIEHEDDEDDDEDDDNSKNRSSTSTIKKDDDDNDRDSKDSKRNSRSVEIEDED